ncbi:ribonuclease H-like domain-containing protein [Tanacetum coccineum]
MEAVSSPMVAAAKLLVLNPAIVNGDSPPPKRTVDDVEQPILPTTDPGEVSKIYETKVKGSSNSNQNLQNVAFVSSNNSVSSNQAYGSNSENTDSMSDAVIFSFFANKSNSLQLNDEDLQHIDADDLEEVDLKWQMAMLTMRARRFLNKTGRKISANGFETIGFNKSKVECYNCHKRGHFVRECMALRENMNRELVRRNVIVEPTETKALVAQDGLGTSSSDSEKSVVSFSYSSTNKAFQVTEDPPCLKPFLNGKNELFASFDNFPCPKPCVQTRIHPVDLEFLDLVVLCLINLLQSAVTELVDLIEPHDHLNPIFIPKCDGSWRVNYGEVVLELKTSCIPSRFGEV